jgi:rRNA processing protein Krr1/Pno1
MEALIGNTESYLPLQLPVLIQSLKNIECHISPHDKHFADVNGRFIGKNGLTLKSKYSSDICTLMVEENE